MNIQKTSWGEIRWFDEETKVRENRRLQVGEVYLRGRGHQAKHLHYDEQVMYCISGEAVSAVNGETSILKPGDCLHYPAGIEHEVWAYTEEPFVHLLISNPMQVGNDVFFASDRKERIDPKLLYIAVEAVRNQFLESLNYTFVIFDSIGNLVFQSNRFPDYCVRKCNPGDRQGNCPCMRQLSLEQLRSAVERAVGHQYTENQWLNQVLSYIYEHYMEQLELTKLAGIACVSESHLAREFKKATGRTIISFIHKVRIEKSIYYMTVEKLSIKETMEQVGYQNMNQFYKYFAREMNMTPAAYLKKH